jgi:hypothetical protein
MNAIRAIPAAALLVLVQDPVRSGPGWEAREFATHTVKILDKDEKVAALNVRFTGHKLPTCCGLKYTKALRQAPIEIPFGGDSCTIQIGTLSPTHAHTFGKDLAKEEQCVIAEDKTRVLKFDGAAATSFYLVEEVQGVGVPTAQGKEDVYIPAYAAFYQLKPEARKDKRQTTVRVEPSSDFEITAVLQLGRDVLSEGLPPGYMPSFQFRTDQGDALVPRVLGWVTGAASEVTAWAVLPQPERGRLLIVSIAAGVELSVPLPEPLVAKVPREAEEVASIEYKAAGDKPVLIYGDLARTMAFDAGVDVSDSPWQIAMEEKTKCAIIRRAVRAAAGAAVKAQESSEIAGTTRTLTPSAYAHIITPKDKAKDPVAAVLTGIPAGPWLSVGPLPGLGGVANLNTISGLSNPGAPGGSDLISALSNLFGSSVLTPPGPSGGPMFALQSPVNAPEKFKDLPELPNVDVAEIKDINFHEICFKKCKCGSPDYDVVKHSDEADECKSGGKCNPVARKWHDPPLSLEVTLTGAEWAVWNYEMEFSRSKAFRMSTSNQSVVLFKGKNFLPVNFIFQPPKPGDYNKADPANHIKIKWKFPYWNRKGWVPKSGVLPPVEWEWISVTLTPKGKAGLCEVKPKDVKPFIPPLPGELAEKFQVPDGSRVHVLPVVRNGVLKVVEPAVAFYEASNGDIAKRSYEGNSTIPVSSPQGILKCLKGAANAYLPTDKSGTYQGRQDITEPGAKMFTNDGVATISQPGTNPVLTGPPPPGSPEGTPGTVHEPESVLVVSLNEEGDTIAQVSVYANVAGATGSGNRTAEGFSPDPEKPQGTPISAQEIMLTVTIEPRRAKSDENLDLTVRNLKNSADYYKQCVQLATAPEKRIWVVQLSKPKNIRIPHPTMDPPTFAGKGDSGSAWAVTEQEINADCKKIKAQAPTLPPNTTVEGSCEAVLGVAAKK